MKPKRNPFKKRSVLLTTIVMLLILWSALSLAEKPHSHTGENPFIRQGEPPLLIAHGGGNHEFPDNTLEAYYNAYAADPNVMMEADVSITKDDVIILSHDTTLDRKTPLIEAPIEEINYEDLMEDEVDFGYENPVNREGFNTSGIHTRYKNYKNETVTPLDVPYPSGVTPRHEEVFLATTLEELITAFPDTPINIDIKQDGATGHFALAKTLELLEDLDEEYNTFDRVVLASFHRDNYELIKQYKEEKYPDLMFSPQEQSIRNFVILNRLGLNLFYTDPISVFQLPTSQQGVLFAKKSFIASAHEHNIAVHFWTINDPVLMEQLIEIGADGIMTDRPHLLAEILNTP